MDRVTQFAAALSILVAASAGFGCSSGPETGRDTDSGAARDTDSPDTTDATELDSRIADTRRDTGIDTWPSDGDGGGDTSDAESGPIRILVFSKTEGYRHDSIEDGVSAIKGLAGDRDWTVEHTEDASRFTESSLASFDVVVWLNTTGDVLDGSQQSAFEQWVESGGGYVGVHAAADTEYDWSWYGSTMGAWFDSHPSVQVASIDVEDRSHPATDHLGGTWTHRDEWYNYKRNPRGDVDVLMAVDESTYNGGEMGGDHPITWSHDVSSGRAFYTGLGHTPETYEDSDFLELLTGAIQWTAKR